MRAGALALWQVEQPGTLSRIRAFARSLISSFAAHGIFFVLLAFYLCGCYLVEYLADADFKIRPFSSMMSVATLVLPLALIAIALMRFYHVAVYVRPAHPLPTFLKDFAQYLSKPARLVNALPMMLALAVFVECFVAIKSSVPGVNPFSWDVSLMQLDRWLHFGVDPWRLLHPLFGYWWMTFAVNFVYNLWFVVVWMSLITMVFTEHNSHLRMQYFLAVFLSWSIGGSLLAVVFSSAGPAYYHRMGLGDQFVPLMDYLRACNEVVPIWAVDTQEMLWTAYQDKNQALISGISAMPSMHNTAAMLLALLGWRVGRWAGIAGSLFTLMIFVGSVHLGWHYAVDAYFGFAIAGASWWGGGSIARWYMQLPFLHRSFKAVETEH